LENLDAEMDIKGSWKTIRENMKTSAKESLGHYELKHNAMVQRRMLEIIRSKESSEIAVVTRSKQNEWG
jgi:hypothetical protein